MTDKARKGRWWDIPVLIASGVFSAAGLSVLFDFIAAPSPLNIAAWLIVEALFAAPIGLYLRRRSFQKKAKTVAKCLADSGQSSMTYGALERRTGVRDVKKLVEMGFLQGVTPDDAHGMVRFERTDKAVEEQAPVMDTGNADYNETLRQIRELNDRIDDRAVSRKIDRIEQLTGGIFKLITERPEKAAETRRFISYYLPVTMKLLKAYDLLEEQRYQGENITASRRQIEDVLDTLITAIERQQDRLFRADAMDVEAEITVLQTMLTADGLTGPERGLRI